MKWIDAPVIPALKIEVEAEDYCEFKASLGYRKELGLQHEILSIDG